MFSSDQLLAFILVLTRVAAIIFSAPIFSMRVVPPAIKAGLALALSITLFPFVPWQLPHIGGLGAVVPALGKEILVGIIIGFVVKLIFSAAEFAGQLVGFQIGFAIVNVIDPSNNQRISIIGQIQSILAILVFLSMNGHYILINAMVDSFRVVPLAGMSFSTALVDYIFSATGGLFIIALRIGAPVICALLFSNMVLGLLARTVPQMNVFIVSLPFNIAVGFAALAFSTPATYEVLREAFQGLGKDISVLMGTL